MALADGDPVLDIGRVVQRTFQVLGRNIVPFLGLAVVLVGLPSVVIGLFNVAPAATVSPLSIENVLGGFASLIVKLLLSVFLQACIVVASVAELRGQRLSMIDTLKQTAAFILPASAITILASLGIGFAMLLLVVPGMILATMWAVVIPAEVIEKTGISGAFRRSRDLTRGNRWRIFALYMVFGIVAIVLDWSLLRMLGFSLTPAAGANAALSIPALVMSGAIGVVTSLVGSIGAASIYFELRAVGEGVDIDDLASIFA